MLLIKLFSAAGYYRQKIRREAIDADHKAMRGECASTFHFFAR